MLSALYAKMHRIIVHNVVIMKRIRNASLDVPVIISSTKRLTAAAYHVMLNVAHVPDRQIMTVIIANITKSM